MIARYLQGNLLTDLWDISDRVIFNGAFKKKWVCPVVIFFIMDDNTLGEYREGCITINMNYLLQFHNSPAETLQNIIEVLLHEMVHCYNEQILKREDTTKTGYHTKIFKEQAEKRGLICRTLNKKLGYSHTELQTDACNRILDNMSEHAWKVLTMKAQKEEYYMLRERGS